MVIHPFNHHQGARSLKPNLNRHTNFTTGVVADTRPRERYLSDLRGIFADQSAYEQMLAKGNPLLYQVYAISGPPGAGQLAYGTTVLQPGRVGREYYMTKGHRHEWRDAAETYTGLAGTGLVLLEDDNGHSQAAWIGPGQTVYVPAGVYHRCINTGEAPLIMFCVWPVDAGHDYSIIENQGFRQTVVSNNGQPEIVETATIRQGRSKTFM
jgi:glucose-6-phosphate isomerase